MQSPCSFWLNRAPWPPSLLRQDPTRVAIRRLPAFIALANPAGLPLSSRLPIHAWASPQMFTQLWPCDVLRYARYPCPLEQDRASWPPPRLRQVSPIPSPGNSVDFPRFYAVSIGEPLPSRLLAFMGALYSYPFRGCSPAGILGLHATPVLYGRTEPPDRHPSSARLPTLEFITRRWSDFPGSTRFRPTSLYPFGSWPRVGLSAGNYAAAAPRQARCACNPCSLRPNRAPWPPFLPAPGSHG